MRATAFTYGGYGPTVLKNCNISGSEIGGEKLNETEELERYNPARQCTWCHAQFDGCISELPRLVACVRALITWRAGLLDEKRSQSCA